MGPHWIAQVIRFIEGPNADVETLKQLIEKHGSHDMAAREIFNRFTVDGREEDLKRFYHDKLSPDLIAGAIDVWTWVA